MPKSKTRRKTRSKAPGAARSIRAQERQLADLMAPLTPEQMVEAEGYFMNLFESKVAELTAERRALISRRDALPWPVPVNSAAWVEATRLDDEITHMGEVLVEVEHILESARNRVESGAAPAVFIWVVKSGSRGVLEEAARLGVDPDPVALAEHQRREWLISGWLMQKDDSLEAPTPRL